MIDEIPRPVTPVSGRDRVLRCLAAVTLGDSARKALAEADPPTATTGFVASACRATAHVRPALIPWCSPTCGPGGASRSAPDALVLHDTAGRTAPPWGHIAEVTPASGGASAQGDTHRPLHVLRRGGHVPGPGLDPFPGATGGGAPYTVRGPQAITDEIAAPTEREATGAAPAARPAHRPHPAPSTRTTAVTTTRRPTPGIRMRSAATPDRAAVVVTARFPGKGIDTDCGCGCGCG